MNNGWIKLHRGLLDWEWYDDHNVTRLFLHCIIRANHAPKKWRGVQIERGQFYTSLETLSLETGLSQRQIRTCLDKLKTTGEVASLGMARGRMVTVKNYHDYQLDDRLDVSRASGSRQADDRLMTANKKDKNNKNEKNLGNGVPEPAQKTPLDELKTRINALRPEWQKPATWNYAEEQALCNGTSKQMSELSADDWKTMSRYFKAYLDNAKAFWRPNSRSKFVETFPDVWQSCQRWDSKHKPKVSKPKPPEQPTINIKDYTDDLATYKSDTGTMLTDNQIAANPGQWKLFIAHMLKTTIPN